MSLFMCQDLQILPQWCGSGSGLGIFFCDPFPSVVVCLAASGFFFAFGVEYTLVSVILLEVFKICLRERDRESKQREKETK